MDEKKPINLPRDTTLGGVKKLTFVPNIAKATVKQEKHEIPQDLPLPLPSLNSIAPPPKHPSNMRPKRPSGIPKANLAGYATKSTGVGGGPPSSGVPSLSPFSQGLSGASSVRGHSSDIPLFAGEMDYEDYGKKPTAKYNPPEIEPLNILHPITIPFNDPRKITKEYTIEDAERDLEKSALSLEKEEEKKVPTDLPPQPFHDEANNFLDNDNLFFIQLPGVSIIPQTQTQVTPPSSSSLSTTTAAAITTTTTPTPISSSSVNPLATAQKPNEPPPKPTSVSGKIGRLVVHKSGRVRMQIGEFWYDVSATNKMKFLEEVMAISESDGSCVRLGQLDQHLMVVPDIGDLFEKSSQQS